MAIGRLPSQPWTGSGTIPAALRAPKNDWSSRYPMLCLPRSTMLIHTPPFATLVRSAISSPRDLPRSPSISRERAKGFQLSSSISRHLNSFASTNTNAQAAGGGWGKLCAYRGGSKGWQECSPHIRKNTFATTESCIARLRPQNKEGR